MVGFDDIQSAAYQNPALTMVRQPLQEMGRIAAETLLGRIRNSGSDHGGEITVDPKLILRETTSKVPKKLSVRVPLSVARRPDPPLQSPVLLVVEAFRPGTIFLSNSRGLHDDDSSTQTAIAAEIPQSPSLPKAIASCTRCCACVGRVARSSGRRKIRDRARGFFRACRHGEAFSRAVHAIFAHRA